MSGVGAAQGTGTPVFNPDLEQQPTEFVPLSTSPVQVANLPDATAVTSGVGILSQAFNVPAHGTLQVSGWLSATAAALTITVDGTNYAAINQGNAQTLNAWYSATIWVAKGDQVNLSANGATTIGALRVLYTPST